MEKIAGQNREAEDQQQLCHVGGLSETLGGVDPDIDELLLRLSGGP